MAEASAAESAAAPYHRTYDPDSSYGSAVRLLGRAEVTGVVLDLGCGYGPVAEPLQELGFTYVGLDVDPDGIADLQARGFEASVLDLELPAETLQEELDRALGGRPLAAIFALDALEHLRNPNECMEGLTSLARRHPTTQLVLSLPNVTHVDVAAKLLLGRWDVTETGLLDRTHLQYFDRDRAGQLATNDGWTQVDADDVELKITEQCDPADAPHLRPGSPLNDLLRALRRRSDGHGETYQFVRRYALSVNEAAASSLAQRGHAAPPDQATAWLAAVVVGSPDPDLLADLARQDDSDFVVFVAEHVDALPEIESLAVRRVAADALDAAIAACGARYVASVWPGTRLASNWVSSLRLAAGLAPGRVLVAQCGECGLDGSALLPASFDMVGRPPTGPVVPAAYALPVAALAAGGVGTLPPNLIDLTETIARAVMWCGRYDLSPVTLSAPVEADLDDLADEITSRLDREPIVHAPGALGPLLAHWRALRSSQDEAADLREENEQLRSNHEAFAQARDIELQELHRQVAATTTPLGALRFSAARIWRALARRLRSITRGGRPG